MSCRRARSSDSSTSSRRALAMNDLFAHFVKGLAFSLLLSRRQVDALLATELAEQGFIASQQPAHERSWFSLVRKGLMVVDRNEFSLTAEGRHVVALLHAADY